MTVTRKTGFAALAGTAVLLLPLVVLGQTIRREPARDIGSLAGPDVYKAYCASCHGESGKGDGPAAPALKAPLPDLTTIAKRSGGRFSSVDVTEAITGVNKPIAAHGSPDMPVWGPVFRRLTPDEGLRTVELTNLVKYIESMQQK